MVIGHHDDVFDRRSVSTVTLDNFDDGHQITNACIEDFDDVHQNNRLETLRFIFTPTCS